MEAEPEVEDVEETIEADINASETGSVVRIFLCLIDLNRNVLLIFSEKLKKLIVYT